MIRLYSADPAGDAHLPRLVWSNGSDTAATERSQRRAAVRCCQSGRHRSPVRTACLRVHCLRLELALARTVDSQPWAPSRFMSEAASARLSRRTTGMRTMTRMAQATMPITADSSVSATAPITRPSPTANWLRPPRTAETRVAWATATGGPVCRAVARTPTPTPSAMNPTSPIAIRRAGCRESSLVQLPPRGRSLPCASGGS